jgi:hypothetical protein
MGIAVTDPHEDADTRHWLGFLGAGGKRPCHRAPDHLDEIASAHAFPSLASRPYSAST